MITFSSIVSKKYAQELVLFNKTRKFKDGLTIFNCTFNWDRYLGDHSPQAELGLTLFNLEVFMFKIYYKSHRDRQVEEVPTTIEETNIAWYGEHDWKHR